MGKLVRNRLGERHGMFTVVARNDPPFEYKDGKTKALWLCRCDCGYEQVLASNKLSSSGPQSCKQCSIRCVDGSTNSILNKVFGTWKVLSRVGTYGEGANRKSTWLCVCLQCGTEREFVRGSLVFRTVSGDVTGSSGLGLGRPPMCIVCTEASNLTEFIGTRRGHLTCIQLSDDKQSVVCMCDCGEKVQRSIVWYRYAASDISACKLCDRSRRMRMSEDAIDRYIKQIRYGAAERGLECTVDRDYLLGIFTGTCEYSGVEISLGEKGRNYGVGKTASLDRIDSNKGYIPGNVHWVHKDVNFMKQDMEEERFLFFCSKIAEMFPM